MTNPSTTQGTWLREFRNLFSQASGEHYDRSLHPEDLEKALHRAADERKVTRDDLANIESNTSWAHEAWPRFSDRIVGTVMLQGMGPKESVSALYACLKDIEVVSVVLRFMYPKDFGILSPPTASLLCFPPPQDHITYYMEYLDVLKRLRDNVVYGLDRVADVDMGLWSAAQLSYGPNRGKHVQLTNRMHTDPFFQIVRFENLLRHLPILPKGQLHREWLRVLAESMVKQDGLVVMAGLLAARSFEELVTQTLGASSSKLYQDVQRLEARADRKDQGKWDKCRCWRNKAVHPKRGRLISTEVEQFIKTIQALEKAAESKAQLRTSGDAIVASRRASSR